MKSQSNPYLKRIGRLVGEQDGRRAVQVFVGAQRNTNESLEELARKLGVSRIVQQKLPYEGALFRLADGELVIKLNSESSFVRRRFTLAHEIGHLLLNTVPAFRSSCQTDAALERTCDLVAAELLMPTAEAADFVCGLGPPSPEKLRDIASKYGVSMQTAALRVGDDLKLWKCFIGMWEIAPRLRTLWFTGSRRWNGAQPDLSCLKQALASNNSVQATDLWCRGAFTERVWLNLLGIRACRVLGLVDFVN